MEFVVLGLLMIQPLTIYELNKSFQGGISLFYSASLGSLQTAIKKLLTKGHVSFQISREGRRKKTYRIEDSGAEAFRHWMFQDVPQSKLEVTALSKVYFLGLIETKEERLAVLDTILAAIDISTKELNAMAEMYQEVEIPDSYRQIFTFQMDTLNYGQGATGFGAQWFRDLRKRIEDE